jgi:hypothetical protein
MNILKSIFGQKFVSQKIEHPYFGRIENDKYGNWNGKKRIGYIEKDLDFTIKAEAINDFHVEFFKRIEDNFEKIYDDLKENLFRDLDDFPDGTTTKELFESLNFGFINIYDPEEKMWQISAYTELDDHIFSIWMIDLENHGFSMDG